MWIAMLCSTWINKRSRVCWPKSGHLERWRGSLLPCVRPFAIWRPKHSEPLPEDSLSKLSIHMLSLLRSEKPRLANPGSWTGPQVWPKIDQAKYMVQHLQTPSSNRQRKLKRKWQHQNSQEALKRNEGEMPANWCGLREMLSPGKSQK